MGLILKIEEVHEHLAAFNLLTPELQETLVYAQVMPSTGQFLLFGAYATLINGAYYVMGLEKERVVLVPLNKLTGKIDKKIEPIFIPHGELVDVQCKKGRMMNSVTFTGDEQELTVKISKVAMGMRWHKDNIPAFMDGAMALEAKVATKTIE
ncbi:hypothetical protein [Jeotgalibaca porci]|uniref:YokE-like PH domain-containing protein n=1 Tax=Jeotgalibaca porci TaxID=1868793 RepID=A0A6G7WGV2_9LACT|nr:hypothetical protein [Jeotgalibaca porci]QIK51482.1 hypothetical protein G7058_05060 [Jeotgalibaca porci]